MKQFTSFGVMAIAIVFTLTFMPQCQSPTPPPPPSPCTLPAPATVRVDSFTSNKAYISWSQVTGNNGYRIRIASVDSPPSPTIIDTTVAANDTNFVGNLATKGKFQAQIYPICSNNLVSPNNGSVLIEGIVIVDKTPLDQPCEDKNQVRCYTVNKTPASLGYQNLTAVNKRFYDIFSFLQTSPRHYHITIKKGTVVVSDFYLIQTGSNTANTYFFARKCTINPPNGLLNNNSYNPVTKTYTWNESASNVLSLQILNSANQLKLRSSKRRNFIVESSTGYSLNCVNP